MRFYTYFLEKPQDGKAIKAEYYNEEFFLVPTKLTKEQKEKILADIATYCVCESCDVDIDWDCDSSRSSSSSGDNYIDVPTDHIIIKDGAFWGYRIKAQSWWGGATSENRSQEWKIVKVDGYSVTVDYYSVTTSDYDKTRETSHKLVKRSQVK